MSTLHRLLVDCDPGIDDALALLLCAASPEIELLGVSCVAGNRPVHITADNACRVLDIAGRRDVDVHAGCGRPLDRDEPRCNLVHGEDGLGGVTLPRRRGPAAAHAVDFIERTLLQCEPATVTLVAVGPLTNLAHAELRRPGLLRRARCVAIMGGAAFCRGNVTPTAEFNFHADARAAHTVLASGADVKLFGLDVTRQAVMPAAWIASLATMGNRSGAAAHAMLEAYTQHDLLLHDACPVAWLLEPGLFDAVSCTVSVDWQPGAGEGRLRAQPGRGESGGAASDVEVFTGVRTARLLSLLHQRLQRLP